MFKVIATLPLYRKYRHDVADHPLVDELRFNTITPLDKDIPTILDGLLRLANGKPLWLDLKTRQLRITEFDYIPYSYVTISHKISVKTPCKILLKNSETILEKVVDGNKLILNRPNRIAGKGEPINIPHPSLKIEGFLTDRDREYIQVFRECGHHKYMISFVHDKSDFFKVLDEDPDAEIIGKVEDQKGLEFIQSEYHSMNPKLRLMAATDDLFINIGKEKVKMLKALWTIIQADPMAIAASRILTSIYDPKDDVVNDVSLGDLAYLYMLKDLGYPTILLSDEICRLRNVFARVMNVYKSYRNYKNSLPRRHEDTKKKEVKKIRS